jgi:rRNA maturation RNase YbeY
MPSKSKVCFFFEQREFSLENRTRLKFFIESIFRKEGKGLGSLNYVFCSDKRLLEINRKFLHHDYYTDIITFNLSQSSSIQAEIYISIDRVRDNAKKLNVSFKSELHRVIFHGPLHLCGFGDKTGLKMKEMRKKENFYLVSYFS